MTGAPIMPRGLDLRQAAKLCGVSERTFAHWRDKGLVPGPWPGTQRYDRKALERALDKLSGLAKDRPQNALDRWRAAHEGEADARS